MPTAPGKGVPSRHPDFRVRAPMSAATVALPGTSISWAPPMVAAIGRS
jgi:hypothetical protein